MHICGNLSTIVYDPSEYSDITVFEIVLSNGASDVDVYLNMLSVFYNSPLGLASLKYIGY